MNAKVGRNAGCPCGSGRKFKHCCGAVARRSAPAEDVRAALGQAAAALQNGDAAAAARASRRVVAAQPESAHAHYLLGLAQRAMGELAEARDSIAHALELGLTDAAAYYHDGQLLLDLGRVDEAVAQLERAVDLKPDFTQALGDLGNIHYERGQYTGAEKWYRRAVEVSGDGDWVPHHNLAQALAALQRTNEARAVLDRVITLAPERADPHAKKASLFELDHRLAEAQSSAERALALEPGHASALTTLAKIERRAGRPQAALGLLDRADPARMSELQRVTWNSERGRNLDRLQRYGEAFDAFTESGGALARYRRMGYRCDPEEQAMDRIEDWFSARAASLGTIAAEAPPGTPQPVFVLGFPRSGTTLVEQILGCHPDVVPLGELDLIAEAQRSLDDQLDGAYPAGFESLGDEAAKRMLNCLRDRYLAGAYALLGTNDKARYFIDKAPLNSRHIGLLRLIFPHAPVVHVVRHPLDTVLSCYFENFLDRHAWSYSLDSAARLYARVYEHMKHMSALCPDGLTPVRYEQLVAEPEACVRALLSFLGLGWDPRCLDFHKSDRPVRTASYEQVTRPIYDTSVGRYRRYLPFIDPGAVMALRPAIDGLGYTVAADA